MKLSTGFLCIKNIIEIILRLTCLLCYCVTQKYKLCLTVFNKGLNSLFINLAIFENSEIKFNFF